MTDLDLRARLAALIGLPVDTSSGDCLTQYADGDALIPWDPINNGADFDEVLMWVRRNHLAAWAAFVTVVGRGRHMRTTDEEFRRAVLQAMVAADTPTD